MNDLKFIKMLLIYLFVIPVIYKMRTSVATSVYWDKRHLKYIKREYEYQNSQMLCVLVGRITRVIVKLKKELLNFKEELQNSLAWIEACVGEACACCLLDTGTAKTNWWEETMKHLTTFKDF